MSWWRRNGTAPPSLEVEDADRRLREAQDRLAHTRQASEDVAEVADQLRELRQRNRFGWMIAEALKGPH